MTISFGGLASGIDTNAIIQAMVQVESVPIVHLQAQQTAVTRAQTDMSSFMSNVSALRTAAAALESPQSFSSLAAGSSDAGVSATVLGAASAGTSSVQVMRLAAEQRTQSDAQGSSTDALSQSGTLSITVGNGAGVDVPVTPDDSLTSIAAKITSSGAGVTASVTYDGSQYHLLVRGNGTGAANAVAFDENGTSLGLSTPANTYQAAADALVNVDGFPVTAPTNVVTGAIPGVTLNLASVQSAPSSVIVASDTTALSTKVNAFVAAYNAVVSSAHLTAGYGTVAASDPLLKGDSTIRGTLNQLSSLVSHEVAGTKGTYTDLASVGVSLDQDGSLSLDQTKLDSAIAANPAAVSQIFTTDPTSGAAGIMGTIDTAITSLTQGTTGLISSRVAALGKQATDLGTQASQMQTRIDSYTAGLQAQYAALEVAMSNIKIMTQSMASLLNPSGGSSGGSSNSDTSIANSLSTPHISG